MAKKGAKKTAHPSFTDMAQKAITALKGRAAYIAGASRPKISGWIQANYSVTNRVALNKALKKGVAGGVFVAKKGSFALGKAAKKAKKPKKKKKAKKKKAKKPKKKKAKKAKKPKKKKAAKKPKKKAAKKPKKAAKKKIAKKKPAKKKAAAKKK